MKKKVFDKFKIACAVAATVCAMAVPGTAFAAETTDAAALQSSTQTFTSDAGTDHKGAWDPASNTGYAGGGGQLQVEYDTTGGQWTDTGGKTHANGTYMVTVPKKILYQNMNTGKVDHTVTYSVTVVGAIPTGGHVNLNATAPNSTSLNGYLTDGSDTTLTAVLTHAKTKYSSDETFGNANASGQLVGTTVQDTLKLNGTAKNTGSYKGVITYSSSLATS